MIKFKKREAGQYYGYINGVDLYEIYNSQDDAGVNYPMWQVSMKETDKSKIRNITSISSFANIKAFTVTAKTK